MRRKAGPIQQWVDSIPSPTKSTNDCHPPSDENFTPPLTPISAKDSIFANPSMTVSAPITMPNSPAITMMGIQSPVHHNRLARDPSFQSDSSHCSSVESLLEFRRADPEAILLGLGFGGCRTGPQENGPLSRIPRRFLQPSKLKGITINDFVKQQQETSESLDSTSLGYRGLTGSPYRAPSEIVQKIMERLREHESHEQDAYTVHNNNTEPYSPIFQDTIRLSVLTPDNRQFLERPRSKSPDMRRKRMIIGEKSFAFDCDGDLIEIDPPSHKKIHSKSTNGKTDNHTIELNDNFSITGGPKSKVILESSCIEKTYETKSTLSNGKSDKRFTKKLLMNDSVEDLITPESNYSPDDDFQLRSYENSFDSSNVVLSRLTDASDDVYRWEARINDSDDEQTMSNDQRRASDGLSDTRLPPSRLSRDEGRRSSDGLVRQTSGSFNRRKSLKRQTRVDSETEVLTHRQSDVVAPKEIVKFDCSSEIKSSEIPKATKLDETEEIIVGSDRLSDFDVDCSTRESTIGQSVNENVAGKANCAKKINNRSGLVALREMQNSVRSIRMEPGF